MLYPSSEVGQMPADIERLLDTITSGIMALAAVATNSNSDFGATPTALRFSAGSTNLWALDRDTALLYNYEDTISAAGPNLKSPSQGFVSPVNEISGDTAKVKI